MGVNKILLLFGVLLLLNASCSTAYPWGVFTGRMESWGELNEDAGYMREGRWQGGLPKTQRRSEHGNYICEESSEDDEVCMKWSGGPDSATCACTNSAEHFCQEWTCRQGDAQATRCTCTSTNRRNDCYGYYCKQHRRRNHLKDMYCTAWTCAASGIGEFHTEHFNCNQPALNGHYCLEWKGDMDSDDSVGSETCECFESNDEHCLAWLCAERHLRKCGRQSGYWCNMGVALGGYAVAGLVCLLLTFGLTFGRKWNNEQHPYRRWKIFALGISLSVLPWMLGVAIHGGVPAILWTLLMWGIPFGILVAVMGLRLLYVSWGMASDWIKSNRYYKRLSGKSDDDLECKGLVETDSE